MSDNLLTVAYIVASAFFILSLSGLSNPETARRGNIYGIIGMSIAFAATAIFKVSNYGLLLAVIIPGVIIGAFLAARVAMTSNAGVSRGTAQFCWSRGCLRRDWQSLAASYFCHDNRKNNSRS